MSRGRHAGLYAHHNLVAQTRCDDIEAVPVTADSIHELLLELLTL
jgi:hypothetical protein